MIEGRITFGVLQCLHGRSIARLFLPGRSCLRMSGVAKHDQLTTPSVARAPSPPKVGFSLGRRFLTGHKGEPRFVFRALPQNDR